MKVFVAFTNWIPLGANGSSDQPLSVGETCFLLLGLKRPKKGITSRSSHLSE
jgi:hypothetical protein